MCLESSSYASWKASTSMLLGCGYDDQKTEKDPAIEGLQ